MCLYNKIGFTKLKPISKWIRLYLIRSLQCDVLSHQCSTSVLLCLTI